LLQLNYVNLFSTSEYNKGNIYSKDLLVVACILICSSNWQDCATDNTKSRHHYQRGWLNAIRLPIPYLRIIGYSILKLGNTVQKTPVQFATLAVGLIMIPNQFPYYVLSDAFRLLFSVSLPY